MQLWCYYRRGGLNSVHSIDWYEFLFDGTTGAELLSDRIVLHFVDGQRGDDDLVVNGEIFDPSALGVATPPPPTIPPSLPPSLPPPATRSEGGGGGCTLNPGAPMDLMLFLTLGIIAAYLVWRRREGAST